MNTTASNPEKYLNLADARLGAQAIYVTDDWFAEVNRMLQPQDPAWKEGIYDENGKWMDGWESRRKRCAGHDFAIVRLGVAGVIKGIDIDTRYFTGNYPPSASLEACFCAHGDPVAATHWSELLPAVSLQGDSRHLHPIGDPRPWSHVRLNIFPDGGVARLRIYGIPHHDWSRLAPSARVDLAAALNGGRALACSNEHYGRMGNILSPGRAINMGDGWETARRRSPGHDWVIIALGHAGVIERILVDTHHFKGNYPERCSIEAAYVTGGSEDEIASQSLFWDELLPAQKLIMDHEHEFTAEIQPHGPVTHVRLNIFPDGGISRLRLVGQISTPSGAPP